MDKDLLVYYVRRGGKTLEDLAEGIGISTKSLYNKMSGRTDFSATQIRNIATFLGIGAKEICDIFFTGSVE